MPRGKRGWWNQTSISPAPSGTRATIARCHRFRKMYGGGMRQVGVLAAAGLHALAHHRGRLVEDHASARMLGARLAASSRVVLDAASIQTNIVVFGLAADAPPPTLYRASGCEHCEYQGYRGRQAIMELLRMDADLDELIARRATMRDIKQMALAKGFRTLAEDGLRRVREGSTSLEEVGRVVDLTERM